MPGTEVIAVNLLIACGLILWARDASPRKAAARFCAVLVLEVFALAYVYWRVTDTLPSWEWTAEGIWPWLFFAAEMLVIGYESWSLAVLVGLTNHSPQADAYERQLRSLAAGRPVAGPLASLVGLPVVDVFIPTYSEGADILEATLRGALGLDYPPSLLRVWVLDDSRRPWLRELCDRHGVGYLARPTNEHGKAGNLNYAYPRTSGEYLLIIDADFILEKNFLHRTLGFLLDRPEIALVQTPQHFRNPDPVQHNLGGAGAWTEEQHYFMSMVESARDYHDNAFCVGSGWVVRRSCLDELGGFPQASICEDLEISYALRGRGYRTLFLNEPLAFGLAPESVVEYIKQRVRWCSGTIQHACIKTGPFRAGGLALRDRLFYLEPILYWFTFPFILLLMAAPIVFWFTGVSAIQGRGEGIWLLLIPRFTANCILIFWLSDRKVMPPIVTVHRILPAFHLTAALFKVLLSPFGQPFKVTDKGGNRDGVVVQWSILSLFLALFVALLVGVAINLMGYRQVVEIGGVTPLDVGWTFYTLFFLGLCMLACVEQPKRGGYFNAQAEVRHASLRQTARALIRRLFA